MSEALFYSWRKRVVAEDQQARFALVATNGVTASAPALPPIQLVLAGGERLEIPSGTDEATPRTVLGLLRSGRFAEHLRRIRLVLRFDVVIDLEKILRIIFPPNRSQPRQINAERRIDYFF